MMLKQAKDLKRDNILNKFLFCYGNWSLSDLFFTDRSCFFEMIRDVRM